MTQSTTPRAARDIHHPGRLALWSSAVLWFVATIGCDSHRKVAECTALVEPINGLSATLAAVRGVLSTPDVQPAQVADTLKPFSEKAKQTAGILQTRAPTSSALRTISKRAADAALALSQQSAQMADYARQMTDIDTANKAVEDKKQQADQLEREIKQSCDDEANRCVSLSEVLARFPAPSDQNGLVRDIGQWTRQLGQWTAELGRVEIQDAQLRKLIGDFKQTWQDVGAGLSRLVTILDVGKKYEELNKQFNSEIERANQAIADANAECQK